MRGSALYTVIIILFTVASPGNEILPSVGGLSIVWMICLAAGCVSFVVRIAAGHD
ncbi:hypothetical protein SAMN05421788_101719 [Filimonas lacunae]|uniref:Uncharacterized protein n=1 Tax=Filimonas lacunae TaxID=477680 RepID=A0A173MPI8_9BACT|nr:hypothetical protein FLA_5326 [Filimonas lacunae]SIS70341.1 hypothetical protein SAMN05421788_101719 [Filimonas lacunae]